MMDVTMNKQIISIRGRICKQEYSIEHSIQIEFGGFRKSAARVSLGNAEKPSCFDE